jgi:sulfate adenylyltransferase subunit 1 (EFTu-like GTPase family)
MSETPLWTNQPYLIKLATQQACCAVTCLRHVLDVHALEPVHRPTLELNEIGAAEMETRGR